MASASSVVCATWSALIAAWFAARVSSLAIIVSILASLPCRSPPETYSSAAAVSTAARLVPSRSAMSSSWATRSGSIQTWTFFFVFSFDISHLSKRVQRAKQGGIKEIPPVLPVQVGGYLSYPPPSYHRGELTETSLHRGGLKRYPPCRTLVFRLFRRGVSLVSPRGINRDTPPPILLYFGSKCKITYIDTITSLRGV